MCIYLRLKETSYSLTTQKVHGVLSSLFMGENQPWSYGFRIIESQEKESGIGLSTYYGNRLNKEVHKVLSLQNFQVYVLLISGKDWNRKLKTDEGENRVRDCDCGNFRVVCISHR